jgi:hypothetical protein
VSNMYFDHLTSNMVKNRKSIREGVWSVSRGATERTCLAFDSRFSSHGDMEKSAWFYKGGKYWPKNPHDVS